MTGIAYLTYSGPAHLVIDLHLHILAGIDDGAQDRTESINMLRLAASLGYRTLVATPHLHDPDLEDWDAITEETDWLRFQAAEHGIDLRQGYEIRIHPNLAGWTSLPHPITLAGSKTLLVELPFVGWPTFTEQTVFDVQAQGFRVLLAHPERYEAVMNDPDVLIPLRERGVLMQLTTGSLAGLFGKRSKAVSEQLLRDGWVDILASDAHSAGRRFVSVAEGIAVAREIVGDAGVEQLTVTNPAAILNDADVAPVLPLRSGTNGSWKQRLRPILARN